MTDPAASLLRWYDARRRPLPWRRDTDPYRVLVSEVMLQQTQVDTVIPFYERFLTAFPTVEALAAAPPDAVLRQWAGLGYYRRARSLHAAARAVVAAGGFPRTLPGLSALPGVGAYTAAAVGSIAFGLVEPTLDGNVLRVAARLVTEPDVATAAARRRLRAVARGLVDPVRPGDSNQALMELGALVCRPRAASCDRCPLVASCAGAASGRPEAWPRPRPRPATVVVALVAALVRDSGGRFLLVRGTRGLWELPTAPAGAADPAAGLAAAWGGRWSLGAGRGRVRHTVTRYRLDVELREATIAPGDGAAEGAEAGWFDPAAPPAVTALVRKAWRAAGVA